MLNYDIISAVFLGLIQGLTEFLPISSTGHLIIAEQFIGSSVAKSMSFDIFLHAGTLLALVIYFLKDLVYLFKGFFRSFVKNHHYKDFNQRLSWFIIFATLPVIVVGYFFGDIIESSLRNPPIVIASLIIVGILFVVVERKAQSLRGLDIITLGDSLYIGLAQVLALIPGVSRSGITIIAGMSKKLTRQASAHFAFLLAIPALLGATVKQFTNFNFIDLNIVYLVGFFTSFIMGLIAIRFLMNFLKNNSLTVFAIYRFILATVLIIIFIL